MFKCANALMSCALSTGSLIYTNESGEPYPTHIQAALATAEAEMARDAPEPQTLDDLITIDTTPRSVVRRQRAATCIPCELKDQQLGALQWQLDYANTGRAADPVSIGLDIQRYGYLSRTMEHKRALLEENRALEERKRALEKRKQALLKEPRIDSCVPDPTTSQPAAVGSSDKASSVAKDVRRPSRTISPEAATQALEYKLPSISGALGDMSSIYQARASPTVATLGPNPIASSEAARRAFEYTKPIPVVRPANANRSSIVQPDEEPEADEMSILSITSAPFEPENLDELMAALDFADNGEES